MNSSPKVFTNAPSRRVIYRVMLLALPSVVGLGIVVGLKEIPYPTTIRLDMTVTRFAFKLTKASLGDELFRSLDAYSFGLSNIKSVTLDADRIYRADPKYY